MTVLNKYNIYIIFIRISLAFVDVGSTMTLLDHFEMRAYRNYYYT